MRSDVLKRHMKTHDKKKKKSKRPNRKSTNFFMTFQKACKYRIVKNLKIYLEHPCNNWIKGLTVGNEWGCSNVPNGHSHALLTVDKPGYSLQKIKEILKDFHLKPGDIQVAKSVKDCVRYISKEDYLCVSTGHDKDYLSVICKAYLYSLKYSTFNPCKYPYCALIPCQQKQFKEYLDQFYAEQHHDELQKLTENIELREWQKKVEMGLLMQNDRKVLWIYDEQGGRGKSTLAKYIMANYDAIILHSGSTADISMAYGQQKYVIFDYTRTTEKVNYEAIENLKNGVLFSSKYQSKMKFFQPPKILCLSNNLPDLHGLSKDRWHILHFVDDKLSFYAI